MTEIKKLTIKGSLDTESSQQKSATETPIDADFIDAKFEEFKLSLMEEIEKKIQIALKKTNKR